MIIQMQAFAAFADGTVAGGVEIIPPLKTSYGTGGGTPPVW